MSAPVNRCRPGKPSSISTSRKQITGTQQARRLLRYAGDGDPPVHSPVAPRGSGQGDYVVAGQIVRCPPAGSPAAVPGPSACCHISYAAPCSGVASPGVDWWRHAVCSPRWTRLCHGRVSIGVWGREKPVRDVTMSGVTTCHTRPTTICSIALFFLRMRLWLVWLTFSPRHQQPL